MSSDSPHLQIDPQRFGQNLAEQREAAGLSVTELAAAMEIPEVRLIAIEAGLVWPRPVEMLAFAAIVSDAVAESDPDPTFTTLKATLEEANGLRLPRAAVFNAIDEIYLRALEEAAAGLKGES